LGFLLGEFPFFVLIYSFDIFNPSKGISPNGLDILDEKTEGHRKSVIANPGFEKAKMFDSINERMPTNYNQPENE